ncbi:penicillin acylase family protein [Nocardioides caricicola]|uniref:Penicillin acylase family protein n=1 Tax=Nocardioides caricicola TaxID=634770 RepID=A0ABW0N223_9ACTN
MKVLQGPLVALTSLLMLVPAASAMAAPQTAAPAKSAAAPAYDVTIEITEHGIPHITSDTFEGMAYGAGWATMSAATCNLMDTILTARGERSKYLGPEATYEDNVGGKGTNLQWDTLVTDLHDRQVVEKLLEDEVAGPTDRAEAMVVAETAAFNRWLTENEITDPACADAEWIKPDITTTDVWYAFYLAQLISSTSRLLPQITTATPPTANTPAAKPTARGWKAFQEQDFGSNATAVGGDDTSTGRGMILGNPHFPWLGRYRFTQMHLTVPGEFNAAGGALTGFPAINIGFNRRVAWSHTVSTGYRFTPYQYPTAGTPTSYKTATGTAELDRRDVEVEVKTADGVETVTRTLWRTPQGYVLSAPSLFMPWSATSFWAIRDANAEHLRTFDTFLSMGMASSVRDLLQRQDRGGGMPWVNTIAADRKGDVVYADHSVVPHVTDEMAERCMTGVGRLIFASAGLPGLDGTRATTDCRWGTDKDAQRPGILGPQHLPETFRRDWVMNANDSYWAPNDKVRLTGYPRIIGCEAGDVGCDRTMRTKVVMAYVRDQLKQGKETPETLASHQYANRVYAAEVARQGGRLDQVCAATDETDACQVLRDWDGRSDATSNAGAAIFQEFVQVADARDLKIWAVPYDFRKPFTTPNTLSTAQPVVDAMAAAIAKVEDKGLGKSYGELHYSGDRGSEKWPLGGGLGDLSGDANAVSSATGDRVLDPVTRGSSYIQTIAFTGKKGLNARTILTYSQYEDPTSPWSDDQTRLFSKEKWVRLPWTAKQVEAHLVDTIHLVG